MQSTLYSSASKVVTRAYKAYLEYRELKKSERQHLIDAIREKLLAEAERIARSTVEETGMGRIKDKTYKIQIAIKKTPGTEDLMDEVTTMDNGMMLCQLVPYGVVCAVHPCTNPCATLINHTLSILAAGNSVIHCPHPRASKTSKMIIAMIDAVIVHSFGIHDLVSMAEPVSREVTQEIMMHPDTAVVAVTGSDTAINQAMLANKKVIAAGPANPVVIVDETADIPKAAKAIADSASFDNNLLCTSEKCIIAISTIADQLAMWLEKAGCFYIHDFDTMLKLTAAVIRQDMRPNRCFNGKDAEWILSQAGIHCEKTIRLIVCDTFLHHPFVYNEMMMPIVPIIRTDNFDEALKTAQHIEQGCHHTAVLHSGSIERLNAAAEQMQTDVFVKNGPAYAGIGFYNTLTTSFTIATRTGEGCVTARHFAKRRHCTLISGVSYR